MSAKPTVSFVTLGCAKNEVDSDKMKARLARAGFTVVNDTDEASLIVVNTCSFLASAVDEGLEVIFDLVRAQVGQKNKAKILVAGCMPSRYGKDLESELVEVDGFLGAAEEENIAQVACELLGLETSGCITCDDAAGDDRMRTQSVGSAYVKISDGCDRFCSYCMIPYIRGRYHSYPLDEIMAEVDELVACGVREIVFIGQDTGIWGHDLPDSPCTADLIAHAAEQYPDTWFRLLYVQPEGVSDELLDVIAAHDNICSYLDLPLQHCNKRVLESMNRSGSTEEYLDLVARARERVPGITLRTTLMAGFPGETEDDVEELLDFIEEAQFDYAVVFPFSAEEGSAAYDFDGQLDEEVKIERAQRVLDTCEAASHVQLAMRVGIEARALVEGYDDTTAGPEVLCRVQSQAPDVDGLVHVVLHGAEAPALGEFIWVRITDCFGYEYEGKLVSRG